MEKQIICKEIDDYLNWVKKNPDKVNKERHLLIKNVVEPTLKRKDVFFDKEMFEKCIKWCERWYYPLFPYQKFICAFIFMYVNDAPLFRTIIVMMCRGNGKDGFISPIASFLQTHFYGVNGYNVDIVATSEDQATDTYDVVWNMLEDHKAKMKPLFYWNREEIINKKTKSKLRYNTSNAKTKDGKKTGLILFNEYHAYETNAQVKVFKSGLGKVKHPRTIIITTDGDVRGGPLDEMKDASWRILNGETNNLKYFPFICKLDDIEEVDNPEMWIKANPSIDYMPVLKDEIEQQYNEQLQMPSNRAEFLTKRMNIPQRKEEEMITTYENILRTTYKDIENKIEHDLPDLKNEQCIVGIDYADLQDFMSAGFLFKKDGKYIWKSKTWICSNSKFFKDIKFPFENAGIDGYRDFEVVDTLTLSADVLVKWVVDNMATYDVKKIIMDTYRFKLIKQTFNDYGIEEETKNNPFGLVRMIRNVGSVEAIVAPKIEQAFTNGNIMCENSAIWRWSVNNTGQKIDGKGNKQYFKIEPKLRKNDTFMAFVAAMQADELLEESQVTIYI